MTYFLTLSGSLTKFSKSGFLLRAIGSILEQRAIELRAIHAIDLPIGEESSDWPTNLSPMRLNRFSKRRPSCC
jgi:NAD(P)H-dependent FMN reductase